MGSREREISPYPSIPREGSLGLYKTEAEMTPVYFTIFLCENHRHELRVKRNKI